MTSPKNSKLDKPVSFAEKSKRLGFKERQILKALVYKTATDILLENRLYKGVHISEEELESLANEVAKDEEMDGELETDLRVYMLYSLIEKTTNSVLLRHMGNYDWFVQMYTAVGNMGFVNYGEFIHKFNDYMLALDTDTNISNRIDAEMIFLNGKTKNEIISDFKALLKVL